MMYVSKIDGTNPELRAAATARSNEIIENRQEHDRDFSSVFNNCLYGIAAELAVVEILGGTLLQRKFNKKDPHSYAYDHIRKSGQTNEIKTIFKVSPFINFNLREAFDRAVHGSYCNMTTAFNHIELINNFTFVTQTVKGNYIHSKLECIVDAREFKDKMRVSKPHKNGSTHYVIPKTLKNVHFFDKKLVNQEIITTKCLTQMDYKS